MSDSLNSARTGSSKDLDALLNRSETLPTDYLTPASDLQLSSEEFQGKRFVGLLACQCNPLLQSLETIVVKCEAALKGKGKTSKPKYANAEESRPTWEIELEDTVLFPEGGGQTCDSGTLTVLDDNASHSVQVVQVFRRGLDAIHVSDGPIAPGTRVKVNVDWRKRLDHMTQHTAQHLLSAVIERLYALHTQSWSLTEYPSPCYIELSRALTADEIDHVHRACNKLITLNLPIHVEVYRNSGDQRPANIPENYQGGVIRIVVIEDVDRYACCGTHLSSLGQIQALHVLPKTTNIRAGNIRLYFLSGQRALDHLSSSMERLYQAGIELGGVQNEQVVPRLQQLNISQKESSKQMVNLQENFAVLLAEKLVQGKSAYTWVGIPVYFLARDGGLDGTHTFEFLQSLTRHVTTLLPPQSPFIVVIISSAERNEQGLLYIYGTDESEVTKLGNTIKTKFKEKLKGGGGKAGRFQAKTATGWSQSDIEIFTDLFSHYEK